MKIVKFAATRVHGYYNFDFKFLPDVSFLVGINGSGKTTSLRLIQAMLSMDFATLHSIRFSKLMLVIERDDRNHEIQIVNEGNALLILFDGNPSDSKVPFLGDDERHLFLRNDRLDDYYEQYRLKFLKSLDDVNRRLISGERPLFLGLERRTNRYDEEPVYGDDHRMIATRSAMARRETLEGLENCARLIERSYKSFRRISDLSYDKLIRVLIESSFDYVEFDIRTLSDPDDSYNELQALLVRREELERFAGNFGDAKLFKPTIDTFFDKITRLLTNSSGSETFNLELLLNKAQVKRFQKIFVELDKQKRSSEKAYAPIKSFVTSLNRFLESSRKSVEIDSIGKLKIINNGEAVPVQSLSSGEKQLIILLTHATFSRNKGGVVIVDEPELSLHLRWQEMLVEELIGGNKNNQYIFATHSPEIVGYRKENCVRVA